MTTITTLTRLLRARRRRAAALALFVHQETARLPTPAPRGNLWPSLAPVHLSNEYHQRRPAFLVQS